MNPHTWAQTILAVQKNQDTGELKTVYGWVKCSTCGAQVCQMGYGSKAYLVYRPTADQEWSTTDPPCKTPEAEKTETANELVERLIALVGRQAAIGLVAVAPCAVEVCRAQETELLSDVKKEDPGAYQGALESLEALRADMVKNGCLGWGTWAKHILNVLKDK